MATKKPAVKSAVRRSAVIVAPDDEHGIEAAISKAVGATKKATAVFNPYSLYATTVDEISRKQGVDSDIMEDIIPLSTGNLMLDIVYGGGIRPAMMCHSGWEQSCKTTGALTVMAEAIKAAIPIISLWDFEGSSGNSKKYVANILRTSGLKVTVNDVFGKKDPETGKWVIQPLVRYNSETLGEKFFNWLSELLRQLPDKKFVAKAWWLVYEDTKINRAKLGDHAVASMAKKYGKGIWIPAPDGNLQGLVVVDSLPAMNPEDNDEEEGNKSLGLAARMFSKHLPRVKGRLSKKMVALLCINQLRDIPMSMYGPKEQEPCGKAVRFNSDIRIRWTARASGMPFNPVVDKEEGRELERSVTSEGKDRYRYINIFGFKNKLANPNRKTWIRLWVEDANGDARGFDPFFDTACYLRETGQLRGKNRKSIQLTLDGLGAAKKTIDWITLKTWVLGTKEEKIKICQSLGYKPMDLRKWCFTQMASGKGEKLYSAKRQEGKIKEEEES